MSGSRIGKVCEPAGTDAGQVRAKDRKLEVKIRPQGMMSALKFPMSLWPGLGKLLCIAFAWAFGKCWKLFFLFLFSFFLLFRAAGVAHGSSQARGPIGAAFAFLCPSNTGSESPLQPIPQLRATAGSLTH